MPANLENSAVAAGLEKVSVQSNPKERQCQRMLKLPHNALISHASKVMLKILQAKLKQYRNRDIPDAQVPFRKGTGTRNQISDLDFWTSIGSSKKQESSRKKNIYFCFIDYAKAIHCVDPKKLWKMLKEIGIPERLTCLLRSPYSDQEVRVRIGH